MQHSNRSEGDGARLPLFVPSTAHAMIEKTLGLVMQYLDSAIIADDGKKPSECRGFYLSAIEELGRIKMVHENLPEIALREPSSKVRLDDEVMTAKDARIKVGMHYLVELGLQPLYGSNLGLDSLQSANRPSELKSAIALQKARLRLLHCFL